MKQMYVGKVLYHRHPTPPPTPSSTLFHHPLLSPLPSISVSLSFLSLLLHPSPPSSSFLYYSSCPFSSLFSSLLHSPSSPLPSISISSSFPSLLLCLSPPSSSFLCCSSSLLSSLFSLLLCSLSWHTLSSDDNTSHMSVQV